MAESKPPKAEGAASTQGKAADPSEQLVQDALDDAQSSIRQMQQLAAGAAGSGGGGTGGSGGSWGDDSANGIELLSDVDLSVTIELGRTEMLVEDVLRLSAGSVVELDKLAGDPVDVYVNQRLIARGEVLVLNDNFCIRISEIVANLEEQAQAAAEQQAATV